MSSATLSHGCPSGLSPPTEGSAVDPSAFVREAEGRKSLSLLVRGAKCAGCLSKIEGALAALPGVESARLNLSNGRCDVAWRGGLAPAQVAGAVADLGYGVSAFDPSSAENAATQEERALLLALGVAGFSAANVMLLSISVWAGVGEMGEATRTLLHWISGAIAAPAALFAGRPFFRSAWAALRRGHANMDVPISLAVILALGVSVAETARGGAHAYFDACLMLLFFLLIGRFLEARLRRRAHSAAHALAALQSATATRIDAYGVARAVKTSEIEAGDRILLAPGERAAVDFDLVDGVAEIDESLVSGESAPRSIAPGARVFAGSINLSAAVTGRVIAPADDSLLADISRMLEAGEQQKSRYRRIADRATRFYVPFVHTTAALAAIGWLIAGAGLREAVLVAASTLIITCPCALGLAAPVAQVVAAGRLFRAGVYLRSGDALERLAACDHVVFDKTGTLTLGAPRLLPGAWTTEALQRAAQLARASRHPLSRALAAAAGPGPLAENIIERPGLGLEGAVGGRTARLGSAEWTRAEPGKKALGLQLWFTLGAETPIRFDFEDALHADAAETIAKLRRRGLSAEILSGDRAPAVAAAAQTLGVETWRAGVRPTQKAARLETLRDAGKKTLMVGDGLNDTGALSLAHASLAPGGAMDASQSAADAVYATPGLGGVLTTIGAAVAARRVMVQNFALAAGYNLIAVPIAVSGNVTPLVAAIAMSASSLLVTLNAMRLNFMEDDSK